MPDWRRKPPAIFRDLASQWERRGKVLTTKEALHQLVDELPDAQAELARVWLADLRDAADAGGPALDAAALESLDRGLADVSEGRVTTLDQYERERGL
jgi:hypothetical protein